MLTGREARFTAQGRGRGATVAAAGAGRIAVQGTSMSTIPLDLAMEGLSLRRLNRVKSVL